MNTRRRQLVLTFLFAAVCAGAVLGCLSLYRYDNKYTAPGPTGNGGVLVLDEGAMAETAVNWLVHGWEYYGGVLLTPEDFRLGTPAPDGTLYIGQYGGFDMGDPAGNPHGSGSYRLLIELPQAQNTYALYLPEIYSAYRLYVNGRELASMGDPSADAYLPRIGERILSFEAAGQADILLAVSDYSAFYSGMVYPPAFGAQQNILAMAAKRTVLRSVPIVAAFTIGALALLVWLFGRKNRLFLLYAAVCVCFTGYAGYPALQAVIGAGQTQALEQACFCGMLLLVVLLQRKLCGDTGLASTFFVAFGAAAVGISVAIQFFLPTAGLGLLVSYSHLIGLYKWMTAAFLTATAVKAAWNGAVLALLCGVLVFDCALVMDRLLPMYEPIFFGWFIELASFVLVLAAGAEVARAVFTKYAENLVLKEQIRSVEQQLGLQTEQYRMLANGVAKERALRHDLRHHMAVFSRYAQEGDLAGMQEYLLQLRGELPAADGLQYCPNPAVNAVVSHYAVRAATSGVRFNCALHLPAQCDISDVDLCILFGNCLENAVDACIDAPPEERFIRVEAIAKGGMVAITIDNSISAGFAYTPGKSTKPGGTGLGLASVMETAKKYGGSATCKHTNSQFQVSILLHAAGFTR